MRFKVDPVPDQVWAEAAEHYDQAALATLLIAITTVNFWNRVNTASAQIAGG